MSHQYETKLSDGAIYDVTTTKHHGDHTDADFRKHLLDIIKASVSGVVSGTVVHFLYKGRK